MGKRFTAEELFALVKDAHAAGKKYVWNVTEPEVQIDGSTAWITYINRGSIEDKSGTQNVTWLESAVLRAENGVWRIHFFHSTRVIPHEVSEDLEGGAGRPRYVNYKLCLSVTKVNRSGR